MDSKLFCKAYEYVTAQLNDPNPLIFNAEINFNAEEIWFQLSYEFCSALGIIVRTGLPVVPDWMDGNSESIYELILYVKGFVKDNGKLTETDTNYFFPSMFHMERNSIAAIPQSQNDFFCEDHDVENFRLVSSEIKKFILRDLNAHFGKLYLLLKSWE